MRKVSHRGDHTSPPSRHTHVSICVLDHGCRRSSRIALQPLRQGERAAPRLQATRSRSTFSSSDAAQSSPPPIAYGEGEGRVGPLSDFTAAIALSLAWLANFEALPAYSTPVSKSE